MRVAGSTRLFVTDQLSLEYVALMLTRSQLPCWSGGGDCRWIPSRWRPSR